MVHTQKRLKFQRSKLGREKIHGLADVYPLLIDARLKGKKELEIYIHEMLHYIYPKASEEEVIRHSILLTNTLWHEGFRKVDNTNDTPMQDGSM